MREIKFRVLDANGQMVFSDKHYMGDLGMFFEQMSPDGEEVMQYTGLKDRHGVEIYEGDILERPTYLQNSVDTEIGPVYYTNRGTWDWYSYLLGDKNERATVIGNIYKNPELLEANQR